MPKEAGKMSRAAPPTAFGPEGGPIDKTHADTSFQYRYALFSYQFPIIMFRNAAPRLAVEDRLCHSAARRALPTKSIHSNAVPEGIWRGTSYYLVERSQRGEWHRMVSRHPCRLCPVFHPGALDSILTNCMLQVEAREEEKVRAHTAASDMQREVENDQHDKFVANVLAGEPERPETPHMRPASPCVGQTSPEHKPFRTTTPFKGERVSTPAKGQMDNDFGGQRRSNAAESTAAVRRSCDPESWETAHKRLLLLSVYNLCLMMI